MVSPTGGLVWGVLSSILLVAEPELWIWTCSVGYWNSCKPVSKI